MDIPPPHSLPAEEPAFAGKIGDTYSTSVPDWPKRARPPKGSPNIVVILMDDLGFGQLSCYGGPIDAPNIAALAKNGLRYNNFHTAGLCSPTRASLLTGRNHHSVGFTLIPEMATGFPGSNTFMPKSAATIAELLRQTGYSTYACGKWHLTPTAEQTAAGPFDRWPLGMGFERYYGFIAACVDHWHPILTVDNHRIPTPTHEGYHLSEDLVDQGIRMIRDQQQIATGRPFFFYLPFGAPHCPFHAPKEYIERYRGRFDEGWDVLRQATFERQKQLGIIPIDTDLPPRDDAVRLWVDLSQDEKTLFARLQELFCGFVEHADAQIGRLMDALRQVGQFDDTLVLFMSDNGASQEGQASGVTNTERFRNLMPMSVQEMLRELDDIGGPDTDPHYPHGWAMAGNAPFRRYKSNTHRGGNADPLIAHWPARIPDPGSIRDQYLHVTDVYPTLLELIGQPKPLSVNGVTQMPLDGYSFAGSFTDANNRTGRSMQYYEMYGSRAIWRDGWTAVTWHKIGTDWNDDPWELYHQAVDFSQAHDLSRDHPERLDELIGAWWSEARRRQVLPLDDRFHERFTDPTRPVASEPRDVYRYFAGASPVPNPSMPPILNCRHSFASRILLRSEGDHGLIVSQGGNLGGWALLVMGGRAVYINNFLKLEVSVMRSSSALPVGREFLLEYSYEPLVVGRANVRLLVDGQEVARLDDMPTAPRGYSHQQEGLQVGRSWGPSVSKQHYRGSYAFTGEMQVVEMRTDPSSQLHPSSFRDPGDPNRKAKIA